MSPRPVYHPPDVALHAPSPTKKTRYHCCQYGFASCRGCKRVANRSTPSVSKIHKAQFIEALMGLNATAVVRSPSAYREQLLMNFLNNLGWLRKLIMPYQTCARLGEWFGSRGPAMVAATDSLLLAQFGQDTDDARCRLEAQKRHAVAVKQLRVSLQDPGARQDDSVLGATDALGICELYDELREGKDGWRHHARGLEMLLRARGPRGIDFNCDQVRRVVFNAVTMSLMGAFSDRASFMFGEQEWLLALESNCRGKQWCLTHIACRYPSLMERTKILDHSGPNAYQDTSLLLDDMIKLDARFRTWLITWHKQQPELVPQEVSAAAFTRFVALHGPIVDIFPSALVFPSLLDCAGQIMYYTMLLPLRQAIWELSQKPAALLLVSNRQRQQYLEAVYECADSICRMAPFLSNETSAATRMMHGSFKWARNWYALRNDIQKEAFASSVLRTLTRSEADGPIVCWVHRDADDISPSTKASSNASAFLARRLLWQDSVGPKRCNEWSSEAVNPLDRLVQSHWMYLPSRRGHT